jgi:hypothetical protein
MKVKKLLFYLLAAILGGCVPVMSLHPLYTEKDLVFEEDLLGTWVDVNGPGTIWEFSSSDDQKTAYQLIFTDSEGAEGLFKAYLTRLGNNLFLDLYPSEPPWDEQYPNKVNWAYNTFFLIPAHTFIKVDFSESVLKLQLTDDDELQKLLEENPNAVEHTFVDNRPVLLASTHKLRAFVRKYTDDGRLFPDVKTLYRQKESNESTDGQ